MLLEINLRRVTVAVRTDNTKIEIDTDAISIPRPALSSDNAPAMGTPTPRMARTMALRVVKCTWSRKILVYHTIFSDKPTSSLFFQAKGNATGPNFLGIIRKSFAQPDRA